MVKTFRDIRSWMYLSRTTTAQRHNSERGSGFQAYTLRLMPLKLYMCRWLWCNRVTAQLTLNKHSAMLPYPLYEMALGFLMCEGVSKKTLQQSCVAQHHLLQFSFKGKLKRHGPPYTSVYPCSYPTHVTWDNLLTFTPEEQRFISCFCCGDKVNYLPMSKG